MSLNQFTTPPSPVHIGIVIALKEEFKELANPLFDQLTGFYIDPQTKTYYYIFDRKFLETSYTFVTTFIDDMGPSPASSSTERLLRIFNPDKIINIGIAGSLDKDVLLGDVLVATQTDNYLHNSKAIDLPSDKDSFEFSLSGDPYKTTPKYLKYVSNLEFAHKNHFDHWIALSKQDFDNTISKLKPPSLTKLKNKKLFTQPPSLHTGITASSTSVVSSTNFANWIKSHRDRKYRIIEMESAGVASVTHSHSKELLIIRGISDPADNLKQTLDSSFKGFFRQYSMLNAISFMWTILDIDSQLNP